MKHYEIQFQPDGKTIRIHSGAMLLDAAQQAGIVLHTACGGQGTCEKCQVRLLPEGERVLACQYPVYRDLRVEIPETSRFSRHKILSSGQGREVKVNPAFSKRHIHLQEWTHQELQDALSNRNRISDSVLSKLASLDCSRGGITAVSHWLPETSEDPAGSWEVIDLEAGDTTDQLFGVAVDVGTTTVVAKLVDLLSGKARCTAATTNPQIRYGDDVISRILHADRPDGDRQLQQAIAECLDEHIGQLCREASIERTDIYELVAAGNTTMSHLLLGLPVRQLGQAPYRAFTCDAQDRLASELGVHIHPAGRLHTLENLAGFVGSDTLAVALAVGMDQETKNTLAVDIGTNGEVVIGTRDRMYSCSCAAGPALEGARISQGSRAIDGAIEAVVVADGDIDVDVIGDQPASTLCGSGLIDAVAVMLDLGILDITGRFIELETIQERLPKPILRRRIERDGQGAFVLAWQVDGSPAVVLTQKDLREMQLAKAAIRAGIRLLQQQAGMDDKQIDQILLAGAFGNYIRRESALRIGLLPDVRVDKIHFVGNAAAAGAQMALTSRQARMIASRLARQIEYVEIAHQSIFQTVFADCLMFP
jgi:uncharacterized 2Fe-2S/4Fe-4S cluster protein (DUF4445 family)